MLVAANNAMLHQAYLQADKHKCLLFSFIGIEIEHFQRNCYKIDEPCLQSDDETMCARMKQNKGLIRSVLGEASTVSSLIMILLF